MPHTDFFDPNMTYYYRSQSNDTTIAVDLSNERQNELYFSEIRRTIKGIAQFGSSQEKNTGALQLPVVSSKEIKPKIDSWPAERFAIEDIHKNYIYYLTNSWVRDIELSHYISRIKHSVHINNAERIANRLESLGKISDEEIFDGQLISSNSLQSLMRFLSSYSKVRYPDITLTPSGNIYARWKGRNRSLFSLHFLQDLKVRFVVFVPNRRHPEEMNRVSGNDCVDTVIDNLNSAYGISNWIME